MNINRLRPSRLTAIGLILSQALGLSSWNSAALAQTPNAATRPALPTSVSPSTLIGLDLPPQLRRHHQKGTLQAQPSQIMPAAVTWTQKRL